MLNSLNFEIAESSFVVLKFIVLRRIPATEVCKTVLADTVFNAY